MSPSCQLCEPESNAEGKRLCLKEDNEKKGVGPSPVEELDLEGPCAGELVLHKLQQLCVCERVGQVDHPRLILKRNLPLHTHKPL